MSMWRLRLRVQASAVIYYVLITTRRKTRFSDDPVELVPTPALYGVYRRRACVLRKLDRQVDANSDSTAAAAPGTARRRPVCNNNIITSIIHEQ